MPGRSCQGNSVVCAPGPREGGGQARVGPAAQHVGGRREDGAPGGLSE